MLFRNFDHIEKNVNGKLVAIFVDATSGEKIATLQRKNVERASTGPHALISSEQANLAYQAFDNYSKVP